MLLILAVLIGVALISYALSTVRFGAVNAYLVTNTNSFEDALMSYSGRYLLIIYADSQCIACNYLRDYVLSNTTVANYVQSHLIPIYVDLDYQSAIPLTNINLIVNGTVYLIEPVGDEVGIRVYRSNVTQVVPFSVQATPTLLVAYDYGGELVIKEIMIGAYPPQIFMNLLSLVNVSAFKVQTAPATAGTSGSYVGDVATLALSYLAGLGSAVMPCALPALISVALLTLNRRLNPIALFGGFLIFYIALGSLLSLIGVSGVVKSTLYLVSSIVLILMGLVFIIPPLYRGFITAVSRIQNISGRLKPGGALADLLVGLALTGLWLPCVGPIFAGVALGSIIASQLTHNLLMGILTTLAFSLGFVTIAGVVFTVVNRGREGIKRIASLGPLVEKVAGVAMVALGIYLLLEALI